MKNLDPKLIKVQQLIEVALIFAGGVDELAKILGCSNSHVRNMRNGEEFTLRHAPANAYSLRAYISDRINLCSTAGSLMYILLNHFGKLDNVDASSMSAPVMPQETSKPEDIISKIDAAFARVSQIERHLTTKPDLFPTSPLKS